MYSGPTDSQQNVFTEAFHLALLIEDRIQQDLTHSGLFEARDLFRDSVRRSPYCHFVCHFGFPIEGLEPASQSFPFVA